MSMREEDKKNLEALQERFTEIKACQNRKIRGDRLDGLLTDMESAFDIPRRGHLRIEAFKIAFPDIWSLYKTITNERWA